MLNVSFKIITSVIIFGIAILGALFPIFAKTTARTKRFLLYGESFASGVFLGAGFIHLLPDANQTMMALGMKYPYVFAICALAILILRVIEEAAERLFENSPYLRQTWLAYLLMVLLSIHSILAGTALGLETTIGTFLVILMAIMAHKFSASFALGVSLRYGKVKRSHMIKLMMLFALMTPLGILGGSFLIQILQARIGEYVTGIFNAIAAGTFIYIAAFHTRHCHCDESDHHCDHEVPSTCIRLTYFAIGLTVMALVAIWL